MDIMNWVSVNFMNGELFFYIIPIFLFIVLILVIFLPDEEEEIEQEIKQDKFIEEKIELPEIITKPEQVASAEIKEEIEEPEKETFAEEPVLKPSPKVVKPVEKEVKPEPEMISKEEISAKPEEKEEVKAPIEEIAKKVEAPVIPIEEELVAEPEKPATSIKDGLSKTRGGFISKLKGLFKSSIVDDDLIEEMEEILYTADIGSTTVNHFIEQIEKNRKNFKSGEDVKDFLKNLIGEIISKVEADLVVDKKEPFVIMMVGVNGAGKTTTIGKLSHKYANEGLQSVLAAGDTFRAAAVEQLQEWGKRSGMDVVADKDGADPASVAFNAINSAISKNRDVAIVDTAGRLQNRKNLMDELAKVKRVIGKAKDGAPHKVILVVDANNGQNALSQAREFNNSVDLDGIIITKLDGTAKGGVIIGIAKELALPIYYIGVGEGVNDLRKFNANEFVEALFG